LPAPAAVRSERREDAPRTDRGGDHRARSRVTAIGRALVEHVAPLFGFGFRTISIERIFVVLQVVSTLALLYAAAELTASGFARSIGQGLVHLFLVGPVLVLGGLAVLRATMALVLALLRIAERMDDLERIADRMDDLERVADRMDDLGELPRWVRGLSPLRRLWQGAEPPRRGDAADIPE
jgi:hypothetical protein